MSKKYIYQVGYGSYEDSEYIELFHKRKISKKEFNNMFVEATLEVLLNRRDQYELSDTDEGEISEWDREFQEERFSEEGEEKRLEGTDCKTKEEYIEKYAHRSWTRYNHINRQVVKIMIQKYGFERVRYEQMVVVDGWGAVVDFNRSFGENDILLNRVAKKFWARKKKKNGNNSGKNSD